MIEKVGADRRDGAAARRVGHRQGTAGARAAPGVRTGSDKRFVAINCAAIPDTLLESELFGYEKGAFTGANKQTPGRIETANHGTLFLDEIGDLPMPLQAKLLRFLQERTIERLGGRDEIPVDVRIVSATHQNLRDRIADGAVPRGPVLSPRRDRRDRAGAARPRGRRGAAGARVRAPLRGRAEARPAEPERRRRGGHRAPPLARQRARARERDQARRHPHGRSHDQAEATSASRARRPRTSR